MAARASAPECFHIPHCSVVVTVATSESLWYKEDAGLYSEQACHDRVAHVLLQGQPSCCTHLPRRFFSLPAAAPLTCTKCSFDLTFMPSHCPCCRSTPLSSAAALAALFAALTLALCSLAAAKKHQCFVRGSQQQER